MHRAGVIACAPRVLAAAALVGALGAPSPAAATARPTRADLESRDLWATPGGSALSAALVCLLAAAGSAAALYALRGRSSAPARPAGLDDDLARQLASVGDAREAVRRAMRAAPASLQRALGTLLDRPLSDCDRRAAELCERVAASRRSARSVDARALAEEVTRGRAQLEGEADPRARALIEASIADLEASRTIHARLAERTRLATLELGRMRTLLVRLKTRIEEAAARPTLEGDERGGVEAIARQLDGIVQSGWEVVGADVNPIRRSEP